MESQGAATFSIAGPPPPTSPFAYRLSDEPSSEIETEVGLVLLIGSESSALIQRSLSAANIEEQLATLRVLVEVPLTLEIVSEGGAVFGLTGLSFLVNQDQAGDLIFSNETLDWPLTVTAVAHRETGEMSLNVGLNYTGLNAQLAYDGARFLQTLARGGEFRIVYRLPETETEVTFLRAGIPAGAYLGPDPRHVKVLEQLATIESKTGTRLTIPEGGISPEESQNIRVVARIVETGRVKYQVSSWETTLRPDRVQDALETFADGKTIPIVMNHLEDQAMNVLGTEVPLGPMVAGVTRVYMTPEDYEELRAAAETAGPDGLISARMSPHEGCPAEAHYMRYLPVEHAAAVYRMVIFQQLSPEEFLGELLRASKQGAEDFVTRFAELLAALRNNVAPHEAGAANPMVTCSPEELLEALNELTEDLDQKARFVLAALLFKHDVLSSGKAARLARTDRVSFLTDLHKVGVPVIDLDEEQLESQGRYVNSR